MASRKQNSQLNTVFLDPEKWISELASARENAKILQNLPSTFGGSLRAHLKRRRMSQERCAEAMLTSSRTISRIINNDEYEVDKDKAFAACVALQLPLEMCTDMMRKANCPLGSSARDVVLLRLLEDADQLNVETCNMILKGLGCRPLNLRDSAA